MSRVLFIVPSRNREVQEEQFKKEFPKYLEQSSYITDYRIAFIRQMDDRGFNLGWNINVGFDLFERDNPALDYVYDENDCVVFLPIDGCVVNHKSIHPDRLLISDVNDILDLYSLREVPLGEEVSETPFVFSSDQIVKYPPLQVVSEEGRITEKSWAYWGTYYKALGLGRKAYRTINGHTNLYFGWGVDDDNLLKRLELHGVEPERRCLLWSWYYDSVQIRDKKQTPHEQRMRELETNNEVLVDGLSTLRYDAVISNIGDRMYRVLATARV